MKTSDLNAKYHNISFVKEQGNAIFFHISAFNYYGNLLLSNNIKVSYSEDNKMTLTINADCEIMFCVSMDFDENYLALRTLENESFQVFEEKAAKVKKTLKEKRHFNTSKKILSEIIDDAEAMLYAQQSYDGGIVSSNNLNCGFSRDDYGPGRGYLALGHYNECRNILEYKFSKWKKFGNFQNADGLGVDFPRHPCDNIEVEQTSYMMLLARDYYRKSRDNLFIHRIFPMLIWILRVQVPLLKNNMLPFNGDETYIAGGMLKRGCIFHGSAEATLMFIIGCDWLIEWAADNRKGKEVQEFILPMSETKKNFRGNFFDNGKLYANNPERCAFEELPQYRHGVCEYTDPYKELHFGYIYHDGNGHYACAKCLGSKYLGHESPCKTEIAAVYLELAFLDTDLFSKQEMLNMARKYVKNIDIDRDIIIGYEPALLLYTFCKCGGTKEEILFAKELVLKLKEETGSWAEYYKKYNSDFSSPHRPWETGYSLEALIEAEKALENERN